MGIGRVQRVLGPNEQRVAFLPVCFREAAERSPIASSTQVPLCRLFATNDTSDSVDSADDAAS